MGDLLLHLASEIMQLLLEVTLRLALDRLGLSKGRIELLDLLLLLLGQFSQLSYHLLFFLKFTTVFDNSLLHFILHLLQLSIQR